MPGFAEFVPRQPPTRPPAAARVRPASVDDLAAIEQVERAADRAAYLDGVRAAIADPRRLVVVAVLDEGPDGVQDGVRDDAPGGVVGWAKTHHYGGPDGAAPAGHYLAGVTVHPQVRRRGIGAMLTAARLGWVARRADRAFYLVNATNRVSIALHERWGFRELGRGPAFHRVPFAGGLGLVLGAAVR